MITDSQIIELLTKSRFDELAEQVVSGFKNPKLKEALIIFISKYTSSLIKAANPGAANSTTTQYEDGCKKVLTSLSLQEDPTALITVCNHILQYHNALQTITGTGNTENILTFFKFLISHQETIGIWQKNPLLLKHLLILTYNLLANIISSKDSGSLETKKNLDQISSVLKYLSYQTLKLLTSHYPASENNIYYSLLAFMTHYTTAKLYEAYAVFTVENNLIRLKKITSLSSIFSDLIHNIKAKLFATERELDKLQSEALTSANNSLTKINSIANSKSALGYEYCLGMDLLHGLQFTDLESLTYHVRKLTLK